MSYREKYVIHYKRPRERFWLKYRRRYTSRLSPYRFGLRIFVLQVFGFPKKRRKFVLPSRRECSRTQCVYFIVHQQHTILPFRQNGRFYINKIANDTVH